MPCLPRVECDFNACGWSGEPDDGCYYVFETEALTEAELIEGAEVFLFSWEDIAETRVLGRVARLEPWGEDWRARPVKDFYRGPAPWA